MKEFWFLFLALLFTNQCYSQWQTYQTPTNANFFDVCVVSNNIIWACGSPGKVVKSIDGGSNWADVSGNLQIQSILHITAIDQNIAWISGDTNGAKVFRTTNGGNNWTQQTYNQPYFINNIHFFNANTGIFLRDPLNPPSNDTAGFFITRNGGTNWYRSPNTPRTTILIDNCMFALDTNFVCFTDNNYLYKVNGGLNNQWQSYTVSSNPYLLAACFLNNLTGYTASWDFNLFKTTNGGVNWTFYSSDSYIGLYDMIFIPNSSLAFVNGNVEIRISTDYGLTWPLRVSYSYADSIRFGYMDAIDTNNVWLACNKGRLLRYNIDYIGIEPVSSEIAKTFLLYQNFPNPFNPVTKIRFSLPVTSNFTIKVFDIIGKEVYSFSGFQKPGTYELNFDGTNLASGIYFYNLQTNEFKDMKKMVLIK